MKCISNGAIFLKDIIKWPLKSPVPVNSSDIVLILMARRPVILSSFTQDFSTERKVIQYSQNLNLFFNLPFPESCNMCIYCCFILCLRQACVCDFAQTGDVTLLVAYFLSCIKQLLSA